jgi:ABC-type dipeptide/oligopeptide/nickel transport systems, permease components
MSRYITLRLAKGILTFFIAVTITFLIVRLMPGDPTTALISDSLSPEDALVLKESFGLDKPLYQQYFLFIRNLLKGDLGYSSSTRIRWLPSSATSSGGPSSSWAAPSSSPSS